MKLKRLIITLTVILVCANFIFPNYVRADGGSDKKWSDEYPPGTEGLTYAQATYVEAYCRAYLNQVQEQTSKYGACPLQYDSTGGSGVDPYSPTRKRVLYGGIYYQNEYAVENLRDMLSSGTNKNGVKYTDKIVTVCSSYTASMLHHALGVKFEDYPNRGVDCIRGAGYPMGRNNPFFNLLSENDTLQAGDIISWDNGGHSMIYIGIDPSTGYHQFSNTCGGKYCVGPYNMTRLPTNTAVTVAQVHAAYNDWKCEGSARYLGQFSRLKPEIVEKYWKGVPDKIHIQWPTGDIYDVDPNDISIVTVERDTSQPLFYAGIADPIGSAGIVHPLQDFFSKIYRFFSNILNYVLGLVTLIIRAPIIGLAHVAELLVSGAINLVSANAEGASTITIEDIIFNKIPLFDINIFDFNEAGGVAISKDSSTYGGDVIMEIRYNIAGWYFAFRNVTIVALLAILIYLGIRMAITSIAEEKAHYKRMLVDWFVSFFIVLFIHYFLVIVLSLNDYLVDILYAKMNLTKESNSIYEKMRVLAYSIKFTDGWYGAIVYIAFIWMMVKYAWKYAKRMLSGYILIMLSPLVAISYALDKIKDNKSQSLGKWMKEVLYTVLIQSAHALIFLLFASTIIVPIATSGDDIFVAAGQMVFLIISIKFMDAVEGIFRNIFGFESSSILKETMDSTIEVFAKYKMVKDFAKAYIGGVKAVGKGVGITARFMGRHNRHIQSGLDKLGDIGQGYRDARDGKDLPEGGVLGDAAGAMLEQEREARRKADQRRAEAAGKARMSGKGAVKGVATSIYLLPYKPFAAIASLAAGVGQGKLAMKNARDGLGNRRLFKNGVQRERYQYYGRGLIGTLRALHSEKEREALIFSLQRKSIELEAKINAAYEKYAALLVVDKNAPLRDRINAKILNSIILRQISERGKSVGNDQVMRALDRMVARTSMPGNSNLEMRDLFNAIRMSNMQVDEKTFYENIKGGLHTIIYDVATGKSSAFDIKKIAGLDARMQAVEKELMALDVTEEEKNAMRERAYNLEISEFLEHEHNQVDVLNQLSTEDVTQLVMDAASQSDLQPRTAVDKQDVAKAVEAVGPGKRPQVETVISELQKDNPNIEIDTAKVEGGLRKAVVRAAADSATGREVPIEVVFGKQLGQEVSSVKSEYSARLSAPMDRDERARLEAEMEDEIREKVEDYLSVDENYDELLGRIQENSEDMASLLTQAINESAAVERTADSRRKPIELDRDEIAKVIDTARRDQSVSVGGWITEIQRENPDVKINPERTQENLRQEAARVVENTIMGRPESIQVTFGRDIKPLEDEIAATRTHYNSLLEDRSLKDEERARLEEERDAEVSRSVDRFMSVDRNYNAVMEQIQDDPRDMASLLTRAINADGGIERDVALEAEAPEYKEAIREAMIESMPETLDELHEFARRVEQDVQGRTEEEVRIVPKFGENIEEGLERMASSLGERDELAREIDIGLSTETTRKVIEEIREKKAEGKDAQEIIYKNMTAHERRVLFNASARVKATTSMEETIKGFDEVFRGTDELRKTYVGTTERLGYESVGEVVRRIEKSAEKRAGRS